MVCFAGSNFVRRPLSYDIVAIMLAMECKYPVSSEACGELALVHGSLRLGLIRFGGE
jgi:hypothetical protein